MVPPTLKPDSGNLNNLCDRKTSTRDFCKMPCTTLESLTLEAKC